MTVFNFVMHADSLMLWNDRFQNTYVVDYLCTYDTDNRTMIVYDIMTWKKKCTNRGSMFENWKWGLWKRIRAVRLFVLTFISGDTTDVSLWAKLNWPYQKWNSYQVKQNLGITEPSRIIISCVRRHFIIQTAVFNHFELWWVTLVT